MPEYQQKKKRKKKPIRNKIAIFCLAIVLVLLIKGNWGLYLKERESGENVARVSKEYEDLMTRRANLQNVNEKLKTEEGVEEEIREKFQVSKDGENVMVIVDSPTNTPQIEVKKKGWFENVWEKVKKVF